jgi:hypothetical protein
MNRLTKEQRNQILLVIIVTAAIGAGLWFLLISPQRVALALATDRRGETRDRVEKANALVQQKDSVDKIESELQKQIDNLEDDMASGDVYAWVFRTMNDFLVAHHVSNHNFSKETIAPVGMFPAFPYRAAIFKITGQAFFHDLGQFFADFENQFSYARIQNVELTPGGAGKEQLSFNCEIVVLVK